MKVAAGTLSPEGPAVPVLTNVHSGPAGLALFSIGNDGTLLYVEADPPTERTLVWVTREGTVTETGLPARNYRIPRVSPRGGLIAVSIGDGETTDIWMAAADLGTLERLTFGRSVNFTFPGFAFAPDGRRLAYSEEAEGGTVVMTQTIDAAQGKAGHPRPGHADRAVAMAARWERRVIGCTRADDRWGPARGHAAIGSAADPVDE